jgi:hypothetical protein
MRLMERRDHQGALQFQELRHALQDGLDSGELVAWNPEAIKAVGRQRLSAHVDSKPGT